ncbi:hypothetical protein [Streptomonospora litoralis]|uniref:Uncharacterized protein n=1 Tax=Streptomonospora litoralis TaxID=2498135 RepID=A0A4P6QA05_9ACTN|nr:hypothetical protein [Streptomonospora litoralis]QBI56289.1 hypothetical protein EKD16_22680 [Streptomonospora litoralis]
MTEAASASSSSAASVPGSGAAALDPADAAEYASWFACLAGIAGTPMPLPGTEMDLEWGIQRWAQGLRPGRGY